MKVPHQPHRLARDDHPYRALFVITHAPQHQTANDLVPAIEQSSTHARRCHVSPLKGSTLFIRTFAL